MTHSSSDNTVTSFGDVRPWAGAAPPWPLALASGHDAAGPSSRGSPAQPGSAQSRRRSRTGTARPQPTSAALRRRRRAWLVSAGRGIHRRVHTKVPAGWCDPAAPTAISRLMQGRCEPMFQASQTISISILRFAELRHREQRANVALTDMRGEHTRSSRLTLAVLGCLNKAGTHDS